jgi:hypothetical protein
MWTGETMEGHCFIRSCRSGNTRKKFADPPATVIIAYEYSRPCPVSACKTFFMDRKGMGGVFRIIPAKMTTAKQLGLSKAIIGHYRVVKKAWLNGDRSDRLAANRPRLWAIGQTISIRTAKTTS